jgi:hypothetical protein
MSIKPAGRWDQAMGYDDYIEQMTVRQDEYRRNFDSAPITAADRSRFGGAELRVLVLTEDWCGDSAQLVPPVARLARELGNVEIRILLRNEHEDLADVYRDATGRQPIPVFILMDARGAELGALLERPRAVTARMAEETRRFAQANDHLDGIRRAYANMPPETRQAVSANISAWRARHQDEFARILLDDLALIATGQPAA